MPQMLNVPGPYAFAVDGLPLACSTNCTLIPLAMPLAPLSKLLGIKSVTMRSEQSLSGAGWRLLFDEKALAGSVDPEIPDEARKTASELRYVLGETIDGPSRKNPKSSVHIANASIDTDIICQRVSRKDGHQVFVTVKLLNPTTLAEVKLRRASSVPIDGIAIGCPVSRRSGNFGACGPQASVPKVRACGDRRLTRRSLRRTATGTCSLPSTRCSHSG